MGTRMERICRWTGSDASPVRTVEPFPWRGAVNRTFDLVLVVAFMFGLSLSLQGGTRGGIRLHVHCQWLNIIGWINCGFSLPQHGSPAKLACMIEVSVYDTKPYDRVYLKQARGSEQIHWRFHEFRLSKQTASVAEGARAVCIFVNDHAERSVLEQLKECGARLLALRCAGFNNVDLEAARELVLPVVRVPAYSPNAVAEHAVALLLA